MGKSEEKEIRDFQKKNNAALDRISIKERRRLSRSAAHHFLPDHETLSMLALFFAIVAAITVILVSVLVLHMPAVTVCAVIVLEAAIAACLQKVPIWMHGFVIVVQLVSGFFSDQILFILLGIAEYLLVSFVVRFMQKQY